MKEVKWDITKEEFEKAKKEGAYSLIPDDIKNGYGAYRARVTEEDGAFYLEFEMGSSCD